MTNIEFWKIIASAKSNANSIEERPGELERILLELNPSEISEFAELYRDQIIKAYDWNLWGAAYVIMGGCSDDGFDYFRDWLVSEGKETYDQALTDPESLALLPALEEPELEEMRYMSDEVYQKKTGVEMQLRKRDYPSEPTGDSWGEDTLDSRFPKLAKMYW